MESFVCISMSKSENLATSDMRLTDCESKGKDKKKDQTEIKSV